MPLPWLLWGSLPVSIWKSMRAPCAVCLPCAEVTQCSRAWAGNTEKLAKMLKISDMRGDVMGGFHNALYLGDLRERIRILEDAGAAPPARPLKSRWLHSIWRLPDCLMELQEVWP